jgi:hypothetical protein
LDKKLNFENCFNFHGWYKWVGGIKYKMNVGWVEA